MMKKRALAGNVTATASEGKRLSTLRPAGDGQSKLDHAAAMLKGAVYSGVFLGEIIPPKINLKHLAFTIVLIDSCTQLNR